MALVSGLLVDKAFSALYYMVKQNLQFQPLLKDLNSKLESIEPLIQEVRETNPMLQGLQNIMKEMENGQKLVEKCSKPHHFTGFLRKPGLAEKLRSLDKSLDGLLHILNAYGISYQTAKLQKLAEKNVITKISDWQCPLPRLPSFTVGLDKSLGELKMQLFKDGVDGEAMVVITAPGGCGKTTLATMLCHDEDVKDKFKKNIFFVTVSENPNLDHIVEQLFRHQGYKYSMPKIENEAFTDSWLRRFLEVQEQASFLVLDGVWLGWESSKLLEKFVEFKKSNCKILVTSRFDFPKYGSLYYLKSLNDEDAMELFHHSASLGDRSSHISEDLSRKVLKCCKGLPLAITVVGGSLCGKSSEIWDSVTKCSILKSVTDVHNLLEKSLKALGTKNSIIKNCFLDLASFPEDQIIPAAALIDMWSELYDLHDDSTCIANVHELKDRTLANLVFPIKEYSTYGYYSEHFVTQHEMLRELAIYQTSLEQIGQRERLIMDISGDNFPKEWNQQMCQPIKARLLSISTDRAFSEKWHNIQLPEVEVLVLNLETNKYALPEFMKKLDQLKVLIVTCYGSFSTTAELSNFHLFGSLSNLKRVRFERISIASITDNSIPLKNLEKISLFMCNIGEAFSNSNSIKFSEAFPNLEEMNIDYGHDLVELPANLCDLTLLKKLSITNCHKLFALPEEIGKMVNLEELRLLACTKLLELPRSITNLKKLKLLDISGCWSMVMLPECIGEMHSLKIIMRQCSKLQALPSSTNISILSS